MPKTAKTVAEYIARYSPSAQFTMQHLRATIRAACPQAVEMISYAIPFYQYRSPGYKGRMMYFAAATNHIGVYVVPKQLPPALKKQVEKYKQAKATLHFPIGKKVPATLIRQLVKLRMKEIDASLKTVTRKT